MVTLIQGGMIHDAVHREPYRSDLLMKNGVIAAIGPDLTAPVDTEIVDAKNCNVYPGLVEAHGHIGLDGWAVGFEGMDYNEYNDPVTPQLRAIDGLNPQDQSLRSAAEGGVTTVCSGPGSSNVIGGTFAAFKTVGRCIDDMCLRPEVAMKVAFGENPKRCYREKGIASRMSTAAKLREMLFLAREYARKIDRAGDDEDKLPAFNMRLHALLPVIRGEMPLKAHAHQANDILTAIRIAREFGVRLTLEHVTEGALIAEELAKADVPLAIGPTFGQPSKIELRNKSWETPGILSRAGCRVSIITDSPVTEQPHLRFCAAMAAMSGMDPFEAFRAITINPARHIGVDERVGSLEIGKDADILVMEGSLYALDSRVRRVFINGRAI
ncbi:MAG: amidohydrolase [Clostridia bacterium]|nr:amidohydrolase [Clostridia bacterium]